MSDETERLFHRGGQPARELLIAGAHVLDPRTGLDEPHDILIRDAHGLYAERSCRLFENAVPQSY